MSASLYLLLAVSAFCGLCLLWDVAFKKFAIDLFREEVFSLRSELFALGSEEVLPFSSESYRFVETLLNGLLRYGHRFTFMSFLYSLFEQHRAIGRKDYVDVSSEIALKIAQAPQVAQQRLSAILRRAHTAVLIYVSVTSLLFLSGMVAALVLRLLRLVSFSGRKHISDVFEREALREMRKGSPLPA